MKLKTKCTFVVLIMLVFFIFAMFPKCSHANTPEQNAKILTRTAIQLGIEPAILLAFGMKETKLRDKAYNANKKGKGSADIRESHGVLQPTFATAKAFGAKTVTDLYDAKKCALYAGRFIKDLLKKYSKKFSLAQIAEMYNLGETRFFKGKTAHKYSAEWMTYYKMYSKAPISSKVIVHPSQETATPMLYNFGEAKCFALESVRA